MESNDIVRLTKTAQKHENLVKYIKSLYRKVKDDKGVILGLIHGNTAEGVLRKIIEYMEFIND